MKIIVENNIPYFDSLPQSIKQDVVRLNPSDITPQAVADATALIVRTRTKCDERLLDGSYVRFIGTATIGTDHIDMEYCHRHGISVHNAPGCNAPAVAQWVMASIGYWIKDKHPQINPNDLTLGIVGVGHVGSIVARWAETLGFRTMLSDPPLGMTTSLATLARECNIITFHTPHTIDGQFPTHHLFGKKTAEIFNSSGKNAKLLLNAARGPVTDTAALMQFDGDLCIDCWENEPRISLNLLEKVYIATPHIAGYSVEGKQRASAMIIAELCKFLGVDYMPQMPSAPLLGASSPTLRSIMESYTPLLDTNSLKNAPDRFEELRNKYTLRHEVM